MGLFLLISYFSPFCSFVILILIISYSSRCQRRRCLACKRSWRASGQTLASFARHALWLLLVRQCILPLVLVVPAVVLHEISGVLAHSGDSIFHRIRLRGSSRSSDTSECTGCSWKWMTWICFAVLFSANTSFQFFLIFYHYLFLF